MSTPVPLRKARSDRGLSQAALAALAGVSAAAVARAERGASVPAASVARRLALALDVPPDRVVELAPSASRHPAE